MSQPSLFFGYLDNILIGATFTATPAPMDSYDEATLGSLRPSERVRWDDISPNSVTIRADLLAEERADVIVLPVSNATSASLTSGSGLSVSLPVPDMPAHRIPRTLAVNLALLANSTQRSSNRFDLTVSADVPLTMGGAFLLYGSGSGLREFPDRDFQWGFRKRHRGNKIDHTNEYGAQMVNALLTQSRSIELFTLASEDDREALYAWFEENFGGARPAFVWVDPDGRNLPYYGYPGEAFDEEDLVNNGIRIVLPFEEAGKGKPV